MFFRVRTIKGKQYLYAEERWRENGKVKSRSRVVRGLSSKVPAEARKAADERYREVLRENVYLYGKGRPGERYAREAEARAAYHRYLDRANKGGPLTLDEAREEAYARIFDRPTPPFDTRHTKYAFTHASGSARAKKEYDNLRETIRAEDAKLDKAASYPAKGTPTDEEEAQRADRAAAARDAADRAAHEYETEANKEAEAEPAADDGGA